MVKNAPTPNPEAEMSADTDEGLRYASSRVDLPVTVVDSNTAAFSHVAGSVALNQSLGRGSNAQVMLVTDDQLMKVYNRCPLGEARFQAANELYVLSHMEERCLELGLPRSIGPQISRETGVVEVCMYDCAQGGSRPGVKMERLPGNGMSLGDYVNAFTKGEIEYEPLASIFRATQEVLECLHERVGVVHGDLHADNILVSYEQDGWKAYIIDVAQSLVANDSVQELAMFDQYGAYGVSLIEEASPSLDMTRLSSEILSEWGKNKSVAELVDTCFRP